MSTELSPWIRWWRRLLSRRAQPARVESPAPLGRLQGSRPPRRAEELRSGIEPLEGRIAPATLLPGGKALTFQDTDGDTVTIHFSKNLFATATNLNTALDQVFAFSAGDAHSGNATAQQLRTIDLTKAPRDAQNHSGAEGLTFAVTVQKGPSGDGLTNIGAIEATGFTLGSVFIQGDLGHINTGLGGSAVGLQALNVTSLGKSTTSQAGTPSYTSNIIGSIGTLTAQTITGVYVNVKFSTATLAGNIGTLNIGQYLSARSLAGAGTNDGEIQATGSIGTVNLGTANLPTADALIGGAGTDSGTIKAAGSIGSIHVTGNLHAGTGIASGSISATRNIGAVVIDGKIIGGEKASSGSILAGKNIGDITVGVGSGVAIQGAGGQNSGSIGANSGNLGAVKLLGDLVGGAGAQSGRLSAGTSIASVYLSGSLKGALDTGGLPTSSPYSGSIVSVTGLGPVTILGDVTGGDGDNSGLITSQAIGAVTIKGKLAGGGGVLSGSILAGFAGTGNVVSVTVGGGLIGGSADDSGTISATGGIGSVNIGPKAGTTVAIQGGAGSHSGVVDVNGAVSSVVIRGDIKGSAELSGGVSIGGALGSVKVFGSIIGGSTEHSGYVESETSIGSVLLSGNLDGGGTHSGTIASAGAFGSITVAGRVQGGLGAYSGSIVSGFAGAGALGSAILSGGLFGGSGPNSGVISATANLGTVTVSLPADSTAAATLLGGSSAYSGSIFAGGKITSVTINGIVQGGGGTHSGSIEGHGTLGAITAGQLLGGTGPQSGLIASDDLVQSGVTQAGTITTLKVAQVIGGTGVLSGSILAESHLGTVTAGLLARGSSGEGGRIVTGTGTGAVGNLQALTVGNFGRAASGSLAALPGGTVEVHGGLGQFTATQLFQGTLHAGAIGSFTAGTVTSSLVTALGTPAASGSADTAIAKIVVTGNVINSSFRAGYDYAGAPANGHAQIGSVTVNGNWQGSDLVAGVRDVNANGFGNADDVALSTAGSPLVSRIASVVIKGALTGSGGSTSTGFEAVQIGSFQFGATKLLLTPAPNEIFNNLTPGVSVREVSAVA